MTSERDPEDFTQAEIQEQASTEGDDQTTSREEQELDRMGDDDNA